MAVINSIFLHYNDLILLPLLYTSTGVKNHRKSVADATTAWNASHLILFMPCFVLFHLYIGWIQLWVICFERIVSNYVVSFHYRCYLASVPLLYSGSFSCSDKVSCLRVSFSIETPKWFRIESCLWWTAMKEVISLEKLMLPAQKSWIVRS